MPPRTWWPLEIKDPHLFIKLSGVMASRTGMRTMATVMINSLCRSTNIDILVFLKLRFSEATLVPGSMSLYEQGGY
jgi:hypothetical protein